MLNLAHPKIMDFYAELGHHLQSRFLLSSETNGHEEYGEYDDTHIEETNGHDSTGCEDLHDDAHDIESAFQHIYFVMLFMACLWFVGKVFARCGLPSLVGEILCGIILGPNLLGFVPYSDALVVIGEVGLVLLVLEAGIDVSIGHLKVVGYRGLSVAVFGSMLPLGIGTGLGYAYGNELQTAFAIGACLAPTSMGIALNVLRNAKVLNTPTGQLIIAAAILDDVIALMLLSEMEAMADPTVWKILMPLLVSPAFILLFGFLAIKVTPWLIQQIMMKTNKHQHENVILLLLFVATFTLIPVCFYAGSSHLLGAFLAGLMFCTDHTIHEAWNNQIKRIMQWMLRVFFACTIGFAVPIMDFWSKPVLFGGLLYFVAIIGKILTGVFAKPLCVSEFFTIGFSMSAWGEFAFILATASFAEGTIDQQSFAAVLLAVLLSVIYSPIALSMSIKYYEKQKQQRMDETLQKYEDSNVHPLYFAINTKAQGNWGHQDKILKRIFNLNLEIIDFRSWHAPEFNYSHDQPLTKESFYVQDLVSALPPTKHLDSVEKSQLKERVKQIRVALRECLGDNAVISIKRWLPGVTKSDDELEPTDDYQKAMFGGEYKPKHRKTAEYCRKQAFKQAHSMISIFERKSTLEDIARKSKVSLYSMRSMSDLDRAHTLKELGKLQSLTNLFGDALIGDVQSPRANRDNSNSGSFTISDPDAAKRVTEGAVVSGASHQVALAGPRGDVQYPNLNEHPYNPNAHTGAGHTGRAGGAGAVPVDNAMINIASHWQITNEEQKAAHKNRDESYMSYIYGDEDSQHHKLPEYSADHVNDAIHFEPKLHALAEDEERRHDPNETSDHDTSDEEAVKKHSNHSLVSMDTPDTGNPSVDMDIINTVVGGNSHSANNPSSSSKLTIKIYPPALQAVASRSPVGSDMETPREYMD
eukprot:758792_1